MGVGCELRLSDTDLANVKFKMSPSEAMLYLQSTSTTVPQLFNYDSMENFHEKAAASPMHVRHGSSSSSVEGSAPSHSGSITISIPIPSSTSMRNSIAASKNGDTDGRGHQRVGVGMPGKRGPAEDQEEGYRYVTVVPSGKKPCMGSPTGVAAQHPRSSQLPSTSSLSTPPITPLTPVSPPYPHSNQPPHSPELMYVSNSNMSGYNSPYATPIGTPSHTPHQSPLNSPTQHMTCPSSYHLHGHASSHHLPPSSQGAHSRGVASLSTSPRGEEDGAISYRGSIPASGAPPSAIGHINLPGMGVASQLHLQPPTANPSKK